MILNGAQIICAVLALCAGIAWTAILLRCPLYQRARAVLMLSLIVHAFAFSVAGLFRFGITPATLNVWSSMVRAHSMLTLLILGYDECSERRWRE